jgi:hypothetical protein
MTSSLWSDLSVFPTRERRVKPSRAEANAAMWTALHALDVQALADALEDGADPTMRPRGKNTQVPLLHALEKGAVKMADLLAAAGAGVGDEMFLYLRTIAYTDQAESLAWLFEKMGPSLATATDVLSYAMIPQAGSGHVRCGLWLARNHPEVMGQFGKKYLGHVSPLGGAVALASKIPASHWRADLIREWVDVLSQEAYDTSLEECTVIWKHAVIEDATGALRALLGARRLPLDGGQVPDPAEEKKIKGSTLCNPPESWPWLAAETGAAATLAWMLSSPTLNSSFAALGKADPARTVERILTGAEWPKTQVIDALAAHDLLPNEEETDRWVKSGKLCFFKHADGLTKAMVETLARKWPDVLRAKDKEDNDLITCFETASWAGGGRAPAMRLVMETILIKKAVGRAPPKSKATVRRRL